MSIYYPYFRGKQYELITVRESARLMKKSDFVPVIEPVKESLSGLQRAIDAINDVGGKAIIIANPFYGDHTHTSDSISCLIHEQFEKGIDAIIPGILLTEATSLKEIKELSEDFRGKDMAFIHSGFADAKLLVDEFASTINQIRHLFLDNLCGKLYRRHFADATRILLRDGFIKRTNREHPKVEFFSELHATFKDEDADGFGDFLIVGDDYSEAGGPAYTVAIHITFIDDDIDNEMRIHHFKSDRQDDPKDPGDKFAEALNKLVEEVSRPRTKILRTPAIEEYLNLHGKGHFPGLGYVKKLSMLHHIETLAHYFEGK